jgi:hypothetical protein
VNPALVPPGVFLRELPDPWLPARASASRRAAGAAARARRVQAFLVPLQRAASARFELHGHSELWVLAADDWARVTRAPYGWPFTRTRQTPESAAGAAGPTTAIVVAAEVPGRLLQRFEPVLLAAARAGVAAPRAGATTTRAGAPVTAAAAGGSATLEEAPLARADARELFDLVVGHEWGHALAIAAGLRTRVKWLDELVATTAFLAALDELGAVETRRRFLAWAEVQVAGGAAAAEAAPPRLGRRGQSGGVGPAPKAEPPRRDLGAFEAPRGRLRLPELVWFQGVFAQRAEELVAADGWGFLERLGVALQEVDVGRGRDARGRGARGEVARALIAVEPSFRDWFRTFGGAG